MTKQVAMKKDEIELKRERFNIATFYCMVEVEFFKYYAFYNVSFNEFFKLINYINLFKTL